jgi:hypothetical protein
LSDRYYIPGVGASEFQITFVHSHEPSAWRHAIARYLPTSLSGSVLLGMLPGQEYVPRS